MPARAPDFQPNDVLPGTKYRVVSELGAGGMGVVYHVVKPPEIQGVLKLMGADLAGHQEFRIRFLDEVRVLAKLDHPNIVKVFDYDFLEDGTPFYVMEYLQGRTVRDVIATLGKVPPRVAFEITRQLCEALHCAHTNEPSVVHRDIKPENIFLHAPRHGDPVVKLIDFGVVAVSDRAHDGTFVGTWKYAAPEQIRGERATAATDIYAVGLVLYEMLCGAGPFDRYESGPQVAEAHINEIPRSVSEVAPWVPRSIVQLVESALAKEPRDRPRDAFAFAERLFELEWANDGNDPHDKTSEGPLSRVLSTVSAARPSGNMQAGPHKGPTLAGMGQPDLKPPSSDTLLEGLVGRPNIVIRPSGQHAPAYSREPGAADTFASHHSTAKRAPRKSWASVPLIIGFVATIGIAIVAVIGVMKAQKLAEASRQPPAVVTVIQATSTAEEPKVAPPPTPSAAPTPSVKTVKQPKTSPQTVPNVPSQNVAGSAPHVPAPPPSAPKPKDDELIRNY